MADRTVYETRIKRLAAVLGEAGIDHAALVPGPTFYYLTDIALHLMERPTVLFVGADGSTRAIMPELERNRWQEGMPATETHYWQDSDGYDDAFAAAARAMKAGRIGVEGQRMRVFEGDVLRRHFGAEAVLDAQVPITSIRLCKDAAEIDCLKQAITISQNALQHTIEQVEAGMSERQIQQRLRIAMLEAGVEGFGFEPIVLVGGASADPHGVPDDERRLAKGEALLIDFGGLYGGYSADLTRTFFCGEPSSEHRDIYETVRAANERGRETAGSGVTAAALDVATTDVLRQSPFSNLIVHKTGHGLGLDVHEAPQIMVGNDQMLQAGMVFTIEPGLYRPGEIGVRIEDNVVITDDGCVSLSDFARELTVVGS